MSGFNYDWDDRAVGEIAVEAARRGGLADAQISELVLALVGISDAYNALVDNMRGHGAHRCDEWSRGARFALVRAAGTAPDRCVGVLASGPLYTNQGKLIQKDIPKATNIFPWFRP